MSVSGVCKNSIREGEERLRLKPLDSRMLESVTHALYGNNRDAEPVTMTLCCH